MTEDLGIDGNPAEGIDNGAPDQNLQTLHALHLDGKGAPQLEDADERSLNHVGDVRADDVTGHANVQSAGRATYEHMVEAGIREQRVVPTGDNVVADTVQPTSSDNEVDARFDNVQPAFGLDLDLPGTPSGSDAEDDGRRQAEELISPDPLVPGPSGADPDGAPEFQGQQASVQPIADSEPTPPPAPTPGPLPSAPEIEEPKVADAPEVRVTAASGTEDLDTKLDIAVATADRDGGSEVISSITISGVPAGFSFVNGAGQAVGTPAGDGVWSFTQAELNDLYLRQPANYSGDLALTVSAVSRETGSGSTATTTAVLNVHVEAVADAPSLQVTDAAGMENALIPLSITVGNNDAVLEGPGAYAPEYQTVYIANLPAGAQLFIGDKDHPVTEQVGPGGLTIDGVTIPAGAYVISAADLANLMVQSPPNNSRDFTLDVWSTSTEPSNGSTAITGPQTIEVDVGVHAPQASGSGTGMEGDWAPLTLSASVTQPDGTEELRVFIADLPRGAELAYADGTPVPQGPDGRYEITGRLNDLKVRWTDAHADQDITFNLVAEVRDGDTDTDSDAVKAAAPDLAVTTVPVTVVVQALADGPSGLSAKGIGVEDKWFDLDITTGLIDTDGSETLTVEITGPAGFLLADKNDTEHPYEGVTSPDGTTVTYILTQAQLAGLQMRAKPDSDADIPLTIKAVATEQATEAGQVAVQSKSLSLDLTVRILSDADKPVVSVVKDVQTIDEDGAMFNLAQVVSGTFSDSAHDTRSAVSGASGEAGSSLGDGASTDGSETITYRITANQESRISFDGGQTSRVFASGETVEVTAADLASGKVRVGGPADWASSPDQPHLTFKIVAVATETNGAADDALADELPAGLTRSSTNESDPAILTIEVRPVADVDKAVLSVVASGYEDGLSGFDHTAGATGPGIDVVPTLTLGDADFSEKPTGVVVITSTNPAMIAGELTIEGATITRTDTVVDGVITGTTWTITGGNFVSSAPNTFTLTGLKFHPAKDSADDPKFDISVQFQDTDSSVVASKTLTDQTITVIAVADKPLVSVEGTYQVWESASGDLLVPLDIEPARGADTDGSESLFVLITGVPAGAGSVIGTGVTVITSGTYGGLEATPQNPIYRVAAENVGTLQLKLKEGYSTDLDLKVCSQTVEQENGDTAYSDVVSFRVDIGVLDPVISGSNPVDGQPNTYAVTGNEDDLISLSSMKVTVTAPGDETSSVLVEAPEGVTLYAADGSPLTRVTFTDASGATHSGFDVTGHLLNGKLNVTVKNDTAHSDADYDLKVFAIVRDADAANPTTNTPYGNPYHDTAQAVATIKVTVDAVADAPTKPKVTAVGVEDKWVALNIRDVALVDTDGSETLTVLISNVPAGLAVESDHPDIVLEQVDATTWKIGPAPDTATMRQWLEDADLRITGLDKAHEDLNTGFKIKVTALATEQGSNGGTVRESTASTTAEVGVLIYGDADKPVVDVLQGATPDNAIVVKEDAFYNLKDAIKAYSGEDADDYIGNIAEAYGWTSKDGSETLSFKITVPQACTIKIGNQKYTLNANDELIVSAKDIVEGKVSVGGVANWASLNDNDLLRFDFTPIATENDANASTAPLDASNALTQTDLSRSASTQGETRSFYLKVTPEADKTTISVSAKGLEDAAAIPIQPTITLQDTDGSETLRGYVELMVRCDANGEFPGDIVFSRGGMIDAGIETFENQTYHVFKVPVSELTPVNGSTYKFKLSGLNFVPDPDSDLDIQYRIRVTTGEAGNNSTYTTVTDEATLVVEAVADAPELTVGAPVATTDANGVVTVHDQEDGGADGLVRLDLGVHLTDTDGSEVLTNVELRAVPEGWGVVVVDKDGNIVSAVDGAGPDSAGRYTFALNPAIFKAGSGLSVALVPPRDSDVDATGIQLWAKSTEVPGNPADPDSSDNQVAAGKESAEKTVTFNVQLDPVADEPVVMVTNARTNEDQGVALDIRVATTDRDGDETATVEISGVPDGGVLTYVTADGETRSVTFGNGVTSLAITPAEARTLRFTPPEDASGRYTLVVRATSIDVDTEDPTKSHSTTTTATLDVFVKGVNDAILDGNGNAVTADSGNLTAIGVEDANGNLVSLGLGNYRIDDKDGSETLSAVIKGLPAGVSLVVKTEEGVVDTTEALQYAGKDENGAPMWSVPESLLKYVYVQVPHNYAGSFDISVRLVATERDGAATAVDKTLTVTVKPDADQPSGWVVGTHTEDAQFDADGKDRGLEFSLNAQVGDGALNLGALGDGTAESITGLSATVDVDALVQALPAGQAPSSIYVTWNGKNYGVEQTEDGRYVIKLTGLSVTAGTSVSLSGFRLFGVPEDWSRDVPISLSVTVTDGSGADSDVETFELSSGIVITPEADAPQVILAPTDADNVYRPGAGGRITIIADGGIATTDADGSEHFYVVVSGVPNGVVVEGGINNGNGSWTLPTGVSKVVLIDHTGSGPATLTITTIVTDMDPDDGSTDTRSFVTTVPVDFGPDGGSGVPEPIMMADVTANLTTVEDESLSLGSIAVTVTDGAGHTLAVGNDGKVTDAAGEQQGDVSLVVRVPAGWTLSGSGYYLLSDEGGVQTYTVPYGARDSVTLTPPKDYAGTDVKLDVRAVVTDMHGHYHTTDNGGVMTQLPITVTPETDGAAISVSVGDAVEDATAIPLTLTISDLETQYFSETLVDGTITVTITPVKGADGQMHLPGTLQTGALESGAVVSGGEGGVYTIKLTAEQVAAFANGDHKVVLEGLSFVPDRNFSGDVSLTFSTWVQDTGVDPEESVSTVKFTVKPMVDPISFSAGPLVGNEDEGIALDVSILHEDLAGTGRWGSETMSVVISGVPEGARIEGATNNGPTTVNGVTTYTWTVSRDHLEVTEQGVVLKGVKYVSPLDDSSDVSLTFTAHVFEKGQATPVSASATYTVTVNGVTDGATLNPVNAIGPEDQLIAIDLGAQLVDVVGDSEETTITLTGLPEGATLHDADGEPVGTCGAKAADGTFTWTLSHAEVQRLGLMNGGKVYFLAPPNVSGEWTLTAQASTRDTDGTQATTVLSNKLSFTVTVEAVADAPVLTAPDAVTLDEDTEKSLSISAILVDRDSEALTVTITGAPEGTIIRVNVGTDDAPVWQDIHGEGGGWTISGAQGADLDKINIVPPANYNGSFTLNVTASSVESAGGPAAVSATKVIAVTVEAVNDAPTATVISGGIGIEAGSHSAPITVLNTADAVTFDDVDFRDAGATAVLTKMTVSISGGSGLAPEDSLALTGLPVTLGADGALVTVLASGAVIAITYDHATHTLSFTGEASPEEFAELARYVTFSSTTGTLAAGVREITFAVYDSEGAVSVPSPSAGVTITVNGTATLHGAALGDVAFNPTGAPVLPADTINTVEDAGPLALNLDMVGRVAAGVAVVIAGLPEGAILRDAEGVEIPPGSLTADKLAGLHVQLPENWYGSTTLTVSASVNGTTLTEQVTVNAAAVNDAPTVAVDDAAQSVAGTGGVLSSPLHVVPPGSEVNVADVDGTMITGMTVRLLPDEGNVYALGDTLGLYGHDIALNNDCQLVVKGTDILVSYDHASRTLTFSGSADHATYADLAKSVVLSNTGDVVAAGTRTFSITMYDEAKAPSQPVITTLALEDSAHDSFTLAQDAHGTVYWNGSTPVLNGTDGADTFQVHWGSDWSVNGMGGTDTLVLGGVQGDWTFTISQEDQSVHLTSTSHPEMHGIIHLAPGSSIQPFENGADQIVFNGSANGTIEFSTGHEVAFQNLEKLQG